MKSQKNKLIKACLVLVVGIVLSCCFSSPSLALMTDEANYCSVPPFLNTVVAPNIMVMLDSSGSMHEAPLFEADFNPTQFTTPGYYGFFKTNVMYKYNSTSRIWQEYTGADPGSGYSDTTQPIMSGSFLNWIASRKIDIAKKLLVGGNAGVVQFDSNMTPNPRTVTSPNTVKLYTDDPCRPCNRYAWWDPTICADYGCWNYGRQSNDFDNTNPLISSATYSTWRVSGYSDIIYPFNGNYRYYLHNSRTIKSTAADGCCQNTDATNPCSCFTLSAVNASNTLTARPNGDISVPANWTRYPSAAAAYDAVDDPIAGADDNNTYIQNTVDVRTNPAIFSYADLVGLGNTITNVQVIVRARKTGSSCNTATRNIQAVLRMSSGSVYASAASANLTTNYANYTFSFPQNPDPARVISPAWIWDDLLGSATPSAQQLTGFGVQNWNTGTCYPRITQVYLLISATSANGGPYDLVVDTNQQQVKGILDSFTGARFGYSNYGDNDNGAKVINPVDFNNISSIAGNVMALHPDGATPLAESAHELISYYTQTTPRYNSSDYTVSAGSSTSTNFWDPYYYMYSKLSAANTDRYVPCAKSFILLMTDGEPTADNYGSSDPLRQVPGATDNDSGLPAVTLWGRTNDIRSNLTSTQNVYTYPIFLFGQGSNRLQRAALNGSFEGQPVGGQPPCLSTTSPTQDQLRACFRCNDGSKTCTIEPIAGVMSGFTGTTGNDPPIGYYEGSDAYALEQNLTSALSAMMTRAASGSAVSVLTTSSRGVGSMLQAYFLQSRQDGARNVLWTGYTQNLWLDPYQFLREDTVQDFNLKMDEDLVLKLFYDSSDSQTKAARYTTDQYGWSIKADTGTLAHCAPDPAKTRNFADITPLWEGGHKLALRLPSERKLFTANKVIHGAATTYTFSTPDFTVSNVTTDSNLSNALRPDATYTAENIVRYIRGECLETGVTGDLNCGATTNSTWRDRRINLSGGATNGNVWKLGDIITSTPQVFANTPLNSYDSLYGDLTYRDFVADNTYKHRSGITLIGANDGMLHAFRVGYLKGTDDGTGPLASGVVAQFKNAYNDAATDKLGEEVWGYIPFNAFPYLRYLADPNYCHLYYNDLSVSLMDVPSGGGALATSDVSSWRTVLIGGMRYGGACSGGLNPTGPPSGSPTNVGYSSYYAIDITDPENPVPMWEFSDPDLGYAASRPALIRTGTKDVNGNLYIAIGSGSKQLPKSGQDLARTSTGYVYILDLRTGSLVKKIALNDNASHYHIVGDIASVDIDMNKATDAIYFGTSYWHSSTSEWRGKLVSIDIPNQDLSLSWTPNVRYLFNGVKTVFTAAPEIALDPNGTTWVYAGSGKFESEVDQADTSQQMFLGFKDNRSLISYPLSTTSLVNRTTTTTTGTVTAINKVCLFDSSLNTFQTTTVVTSINTGTATSPSIPANGWYINLSTSPASERVITQPLVVGGLVDFLTYQPSSDVCSGGGTTYLCSVDYRTGVAPATLAIVSPQVTGGQTNLGSSVTVQRCISLGAGAPPKAPIPVPPPPPPPPREPPVPPPGSEPPYPGGEKVPKLIQGSTGAIQQIQNNPSISVKSKILQWLKK